MLGASSFSLALPAATGDGNRLRHRQPERLDRVPDRHSGLRELGDGLLDLHEGDGGVEVGREREDREAHGDDAGDQRRDQDLVLRRGLARIGVGREVLAPAARGEVGAQSQNRIRAVWRASGGKSSVIAMSLVPHNGAPRIVLICGRDTERLAVLRVGPRRVGVAPTGSRYRRPGTGRRHQTQRSQLL